MLHKSRFAGRCRKSFEGSKYSELEISSIYKWLCSIWMHLINRYCDGDILSVWMHLLLCSSDHILWCLLWCKYVFFFFSFTFMFWFLVVRIWTPEQNLNTIVLSIKLCPKHKYINDIRTSLVTAYYLLIKATATEAPIWDIKWHNGHFWVQNAPKYFEHQICDGSILTRVVHGSVLPDNRFRLIETDR